MCQGNKKKRYTPLRWLLVFWKNKEKYMTKHITKYMEMKIMEEMIKDSEKKARGFYLLTMGLIEEKGSIIREAMVNK